MNQQLDLSQRMAAALARAGKPLQTFDNEPEDGAELLGVVPVSLQHLHNLVTELQEEAVALSFEDQIRAQHRSKEQELVLAVFFASLRNHAPPPQDCYGIVLTNGWKVYTVKPPQHSPVDDLMAAMMASGRFRVINIS